MAMRCHYEVLGLNINSTNDEIKKAYRKFALRWHPDKNPENREESTKEFLLIQQAYEVLVDPQERAWYDKHRESILRGGLGKGDRYEDNSLNLFFYFRASCYKGFGGDPQGFFEIYSDVFRQIFEEETEFLDRGMDVTTAPEFGCSQSPYEEVVKPFYAYWEGYCTSKSYVWVEKYDTRMASCRQERRLMEQENKRLRNKARKERNEEVRALIAFVKKRDPRVQEYNKKLQARAAEISKLTEERRINEKKKRLEQMQLYKESDWSSHSGLSEQLERLEKQIAAEFEDDDDDDDDDDYEEEDLEDGVREKNDNAEPADEEGNETVENDEIFDLNKLEELYCVACDKIFKSLNALQNHKKSKKHIVNESNLIQEMRSNDVTATDEDDVCEVINDEGKDDPLNNIQPAKSLSKKQKKNKKKSVEPSLPEEREHKHVEPEVSTCEKTDITTEKPTKPPKSENKEKEFVCNVCGYGFKTRNKLFEHIKAEGHALRVEPTEVPKTSSKKEKNRKLKPR